MNEVSPAVADNQQAASHDHGHDPFLAHHFDSPRQQFDAGKLGMWLFLVTEVLFFSGLFVAYAVYRSTHPEVFVDAHHYLDKTLGAINTAVLIFSSLTMAWGVRAAQINATRTLIWCLIITLACASLFMGIKAVEYSHKWDEGLYWAGAFSHVEGAAEHVSHGLSPKLIALCIPATLALVFCALGTLLARARGKQAAFVLFGGMTIAAAAFFGGVATAKIVPAAQAAIFGDGAAVGGEHAAGEHAADGHENSMHAEAAATAATEPVADGEQPPAEASTDVAGTPVAAAVGDEQLVAPSMTGVFFSIYYCMTGVHAVHILAGMGVIAWLLWRAAKGHFSERYFGPVDYVGLYWHIVDLVWIYLFPLLYLIH